MFLWDLPPRCGQDEVFLASSFQGLPQGVLLPLGLTLGPYLLGALVPDLSQPLWKALSGEWRHQSSWGGGEPVSGPEYSTGGFSLAWDGLSPSVAA